MATKQTDTIEAEENEGYSPNMDYNVDERALNYISFKGEMLRAYQISSAIESTPSYTRRKCNDLYEEDLLMKECKGDIIGHPMPPNGDVVVLEGNRDRLLEIINEYGTPGQYLQALGKSSINDLRKLIKENIAIGEGYSLNTKKVFFAPLVE